MISADDVTMAYRLILGREPEDRRVVEEAARHHADLAALRRTFLSSEEFRGKLAAMDIGPLTWSGREGPIEVDVQVDPATLERLLARVQDTWSHLAETEPHWAVLTCNEFTRDRIAETVAAFYESGRSEAELLIGALRRHRIVLPGDTHCVELGCGVGRVTGWLARIMPRVTGIDVAAPMLQHARTHIGALGLANTGFMHLDRVERLTALPPSDVVFSRIVLQHNPPPVIAHMLRLLLSGLRPGGVALFQVPTYAPGYRFRAAEYLASDDAGRSMEMHVLPQESLFAVIAETGCRLLEIVEDDCVGNRLWRSNTLLVRKRSPGVDPA